MVAKRQGSGVRGQGSGKARTTKPKAKKRALSIRDELRRRSLEEEAKAVAARSIRRELTALGLLRPAGTAGQASSGTLPSKPVPGEVTRAIDLAQLDGPDAAAFRGEVEHLKVDTYQLWGMLWQPRGDVDLGAFEAKLDVCLARIFNVYEVLHPGVGKQLREKFELTKG